MTPVRFGIIGCSSIARRRMVPAIRASAGARLEHVGSRDARKAEPFAREFGCSKFGSYEAVLADLEVDAVYISTPPALHEPWVRAAAESGKHILCEKPAFLELRVAEEMVELCGQRGVRLMEGYAFRYHPQHALVRMLITEGRIGAPRVAQAEWALPRPNEGNFRLQPETGGGVFLDAAGYPVAAAMLLFDASPDSVFCQAERDAATGVDSSVSLLLSFEGGRVAHGLAAYGLQYGSRYSLIGPRGRIVLPRAFSVPSDMETKVMVETDAGAENLAVPPADQFRLMLEDFCGQLTKPPGQARTFEQELLRQHTVMDAAWRSHLERKPVSVTNVSNV
jgi:predicted dehydrogenase